jgi:hypothetical protein
MYHNKENRLFGPLATVDLAISGQVNGNNTFFTALSPGNFVAIPGTNPSYFRIDSIIDDTTMTVTGLTINAVTNSPIYLASDGDYDSYYRSNAHLFDDFQEYLTFEAGITFVVTAVKSTLAVVMPVN